MDRETRRALVIEAACTEEYEDQIAWALHALEEGADSESLCVLASMILEEFPNHWETDALFQKSLKELGWSPLRREELLRQHARDLCENFLSARLEPKRFTYAMYRLAMDLNFPRDFDVWIGLDDGWDLVGAWHPSKEDLVEDIRQEARNFIASTAKIFC